MDRWLIGICVAFGVVFSANAVLVYFATSAPLEIEASYAETHR